MITKKTRKERMDGRHLRGLGKDKLIENDGTEERTGKRMAIEQRKGEGAVKVRQYLYSR